MRKLFGVDEDGEREAEAKLLEWARRAVSAPMAPEEPGASES